MLVEGVPVSAVEGGSRRRFLRRLPRDPFADPALPAAETWALRASNSGPDAPRSGRDVFDLASRHDRLALDGTRYTDW
jgi:general secretion pathway protein G